jgi:hypothetical protein
MKKNLPCISLQVSQMYQMIADLSNENRCIKHITLEDFKK